MMPWQGMQTRKVPDCPNWTPDMREVHLESNIWPHVPGLHQFLFTEVINEQYTYYSGVSCETL